MKRRTTAWAGFAAAIFTGGALWAVIPSSTGWAEQTHRALSKVYTVDKKYRSMKGPQSTQSFKLGNEAKNELLWITGYEAKMVGPDGKTPRAQEFMCHSNLDLDPVAHREALRVEGGISGRLFTLSQGQFVIRFPSGFGIPVRSSESLNLTTQVLNLNHAHPNDLKVRHNVTVSYQDHQSSNPMKPLFQKSAYGLALLEGEDGHFGMSHEQSKDMQGTGCMEGQNASDHVYEDGEGRKFTGHWVVQPGREVNRTPVTQLLSLPYDTTVHYIAVHLHPFARSLELIDKTAQKTVFRSEAKNYPHKIGLKHVDAFSSSEGFMMHKDHEYELVSVYENTTEEPQDSMAVMYLYLLDKRFEAP